MSIKKCLKKFVTSLVAPKSLLKKNLKRFVAMENYQLSFVYEPLRQLLKLKLVVFVKILQSSF